MIGFSVLVQLAQKEKKLGDEAHVAAAVAMMGGMLKRCGILVE